MLKPYFQVLRVPFKRRRDHIAQGRDRSGCEAVPIWGGPHKVGQAAIRQTFHRRVGFPIQLVVTQCCIAGGIGDGADVGADKQVDFVFVGQLLHSGNGLLGIGSVTTHQFYFAAKQTTTGIDLLYRQFKAARHFCAVQRQWAAEWIDSTYFYHLLRVCSLRQCGCT